MSKSVERTHLGPPKYHTPETKCMYTFQKFPQTSQLRSTSVSDFSFTIALLFDPLNAFKTSHVFFAPIFQPIKSAHTKAPTIIITAISISALTAPAAPAKVGEPVALEFPAPVTLG